MLLKVRLILLYVDFFVYFEIWEFYADDFESKLVKLVWLGLKTTLSEISVFISEPGKLIVFYSSSKSYSNTDGSKPDAC